ncbi:hypothetical protein ASPWEDRAFT_177675 [Aspergillus wentii DTO 134E9]|uniref:Uncharacterized protein n=1 Tax=Aspergillus wentii DTO 134E9 TaxID=1073089 RepID=A0A1L9R4X4_ASPWE|nr:uncharacterized protein ASPWEDRAFT_177675 [Aspergillus wentii DTO 134E9]KAI9927217.1 hypothetical protein MW887_003601 [Aspergillus wentii]OJJ29942.1 hypothetical protein ASPWEDRAFT_177675 [Aspergillus wentii DTO 134E9]
MRFSTLFSVFLATLSVGVGAGPIGAPSDVQECSGDISNNSVDYGDVEKRAPPKESERLRQIQKSLGKKKLEQGKEYAIQVTWTKGKAGSSTPTDLPPQQEMKATQNQYGFDHTAILVGKVQKNTDFELDFEGEFYHLDSKTERHRGQVYFKTFPKTGKWEKSDTTKTLKFLEPKELSGDWKSKVEHAQTEAAKVGTKYNNVWKGKKNDCQTYVKAFQDAL